MRGFTPAQRALALILAASAIGAVVWFTIGGRTPEPEPVEPPVEAADVTSSDCRECHLPQYESWHKSYHRTMTRDATPEYVKGRFDNAQHDHQGLATRLTQVGNEFFMELPDPNWAAARAKAIAQSSPVPTVKHQKFRVDRLVGSHWIQEYLHRDPSGKFIRLPVLYHIGRQQWVHSLGAFLAPDSDDFWARSRGANWNESCLYCHNTEPSKNPVRDVRGSVAGYETAVLELGIACAACHGSGKEHVRDPHTASDVVQPARLGVQRRDEICARCHGALVPKASTWNPRTHRDPFIPGSELWRYNSLFRSEAEQLRLAGVGPRAAKVDKPLPDDGRFWGDGTPLTTALEYNGMSMSACYQDGKGTLSCLSCHTMHGNDPNFMLKDGMQSNAACYSCHPTYRDRLAEHTRHGADSSGSLCYNCHMPHQVYSLMTTHRSHRIQIPDLASSLGTGKPHACNACHLDKSLGWTRDELVKWPNGKRNAAGTLDKEEDSIASSVLILSRGDARSRVVVAGAFSRKDARKASGKDWTGSMLVRLMAEERYPIVRDLLGRGLPESEYDPLAISERRAKQLDILRLRFDASPTRRAMPFFPLNKDGLPNETILQKLRPDRRDPDLTINE